MQIRLFACTEIGAENSRCRARRKLLSYQPMKHQLDFEKPIAELQAKLEELKKHPETHSLGISFEEEVALIEKKLEETKRQIFLNLSAWDRDQDRPASQTARSPSTISIRLHRFQRIAWRPAVCRGPGGGRRVRLPWPA